MTAKIQPKNEPKYTAVFIKRESDLGFRAYRVTLQDNKILNTEPLMLAPDLEVVAVEVARRELENARWHSLYLSPAFQDT